MRKLALLLLLLVPVTAAAQEASFEITPMAGYRFIGEFDISDRIFNEEVEVDESVTYGVILGLPLSRNLQLEFLANRQDSELIDSGGLFSPDDTIADIEVTHVHVGVLGQFGSGQVLPFVVGSVGVARLDVADPDFATEDRFALSAGGGVKILVSDNFGFRFEGRVYYIDLGDDDRSRDRYEYRDSLTNVDASLGLIFAF